MYETIMGSVAYGVNTDTSDFDTVGFCIPNKDIVFPHLRGVDEDSLECPNLRRSDSEVNKRAPLNLEYDYGCACRFAGQCQHH